MLNESRLHLRRSQIDDEVEPKRVVPQLSSLNVTPNEPLTITFPHKSITVIHLQEK
jgi:hypothetical protein